METIQYIVFLSFLIFYLTIILYLSNKLKDIKTNPSKYQQNQLQDEVNYYKQTKKFNHFFFKSLSHKYVVIYGFPMFLFSLLIFYFLLNAYLNILVGDKGTLLTFGPTYTSIIAFMFLSIILTLAYIPLHSKNIKLAVLVCTIFNEVTRYGIWKKTYLSLLIIFIITFPVIYLGANNFGYYNENGIYTSSYFEISGVFTKYEDIKNIKIYVHHDNSNDVDTLHYDITLNDGKTFNINNTNFGERFFNKNTYYLHLHIENKYTGQINITPLNDIDYQYLSDFPDETKQYIIYIFDGLHE